jgi:hypothetical protein
MNLKTEKKIKRELLIQTVKSEFQLLKSIPGTMKTAIYDELAKKHGKTNTTIRNYLSDK